MNIKTAFEIITERFEKAGVDSPAFEASILLEDLFSLPKMAKTAVPEKELSAEDEEKLFSAAEKRCGGYPLQYIIGNWEFYGRKFFVGEGVLIPRPETELIIDLLIRYYSRSMPPKIIDLCSGTGCIAITAAKEIPGASVTAVELYDEAFEYLLRNNTFHENCVNPVRGDALEAFGEFDCVVSNPPYITADEMKSLQTEVTFEPETALFGGDDGLDFYRAIAKNWSGHISSGGLIVFEIGDTQGEEVKNILLESGYMNPSVIMDYEGRDRVITATKI